MVLKIHNMLSCMKFLMGGFNLKEIVLISHGKMAAGVKSSLEMIIGAQAHVHTASVREDGDKTQFESEFLDLMKTLQRPVLVIADLLGGTPCNVATEQFLEDEEVVLLAGMSLPVVMEAALNEKATSTDLVQIGKEAVVDVNYHMEAEQDKSKEPVESTDFSLYADYAGKANIVNVRIDERLIHGQVAGIWTTSLDTQRIIVINDEAATDPLQKSSLRMAAPSSMRLSVLPVEEAALNINNGKYGLQRLFLLFKNPTDVLRFVETGGIIDAVNVGNMSYKEEAREVTKSIKVLPKEETVFQKIHDHGIKITAQLVPSDPVVDFMKKLKNN